MRSDKDFTARYREQLTKVNPSTRKEIDADEARLLGKTELCLTYLHHFLPEDPISTVPFLMMGYPSLLDGGGPKAEAALMTLRHLCVRFGSVSAWVDATVRYSRTPETIRCFELRAQRAVLRSAAPDNIRSLMSDCLDTTVPWAVRKLTIASPGAATVIADHGRKK